MDSGALAVSESDGMGVPEVLILLLVVGVWASQIFLLVDVLRRPDAEFAAAGENRTRWLMLSIVGLCFWPAGLVLLVVWLTKTRPKLTRRS